MQKKTFVCFFKNLGVLRLLKTTHSKDITEVISKSPWELHFEKSENNFPPGFYFIAFLVLRHLLVERKEILNQSHNFY